MIASSALRASASQRSIINLASVVSRNGMVPRISSNKMSAIAHARRMTTVPRDKFTGKRTTLDVKIPTPSPTEPEPEGAKIPYVPTYWSSERASTEVPDISSPTVMTVASSATHLGGGPTGPSATKIDTHSQEVGEGAAALSLRAAALWDLVKKVGPVSMPKSFKDASDALSRFVSIPEIKADTTSRSTGPRNLDEEERRGVWILFGIVAGGWLAGGIFAKNGTPKPKHAAHH